MRTIPSPYLTARALLADDEAWQTLLEVDVAPGQKAYLADSSDHIVAGGITWQACAMLIEGVGESAEGDLSQIKVTVSNVSGIPIALVELGQILGGVATIRFVHESDLATLPDDLAFPHTILSAEIDSKRATFTAGESEGMPRVPAGVYTRAAFPQIRRLGPR